MLAETMEFGGYITTGVGVGTFLLGLLGGRKLEQRRNGRRDNPGTDLDRHRYPHERKSKGPGLAETCLKHTNGISANKAAVAALGAQQEAIHKSQDETKHELHEMRKETRDAFTAVHGRLDTLLSQRSTQ